MDGVVQPDTLMCSATNLVSLTKSGNNGKMIAGAMEIGHQGALLTPNHSPGTGIVGSLKFDLTGPLTIGT
jgi:hypothetical protein